MGDTVADTMDALNEEMEINKEISESLAQGSDDILTDEDLLKDLAELETEASSDIAPVVAETSTLPAVETVFSLPEAPDAPISSGHNEQPGATDEEKELRALQASMGL